MKLILVLAFCALAAAAPKVVKESPSTLLDFNAVESSQETRSFLVNAVVNQLIAYVRRVINNGSNIFGIPPLDPLILESYHLKIPAGLINIDLDLKNVLAVGAGSFVVNRSNLNLADLTFDLDITVPGFDVSAEQYDLIGDFFTAIPVYGKGKAIFKVEAFRVRGRLFLKQSEDGKSVLIERIEDASFEVPYFKTVLTGAIGGGDIDAIVNAMVDEVIIDYVNRFQGVISLAGSRVLVKLLNPGLARLDTWKFIAPLMPRN